MNSATSRFKLSNKPYIIINTITKLVVQTPTTITTITTITNFFSTTQQPHRKETTGRVQL